MFPFDEALNALLGNFFMHEVHAQIFNGLLLYGQVSKKVFPVATDIGADFIDLFFCYRLATQ